MAVANAIVHAPGENWWNVIGNRFQRILSIFSFEKMNETTAPAQHVGGEVHAQINGGQTTISDYSAVTVEGKLCDVGLEGFPSKGELTPITNSREPVRKKSQIVKWTKPHHSHTFASKRGRSSQRTRAAAGAFYRFCSSTLLKRQTIRNRKRTYARKVCKQRLNLLYLKDTERMVTARQKFRQPYLKHNVVVFDGGEEGVPNLIANGARWACTRIENGGLDVCHPPNSRTGIAYEREDNGELIFILLPRDEALNINSGGSKLCEAMRNVMKSQKNLKRGKSKTVFSDTKYCSVGSKPRRNAPGVEPGRYKMEEGVDCKHWDEMIRAIKRGEHALEGYSGTDVIRRIHEASKLVDWEKPQSTSGKKNGNVFNGVAFGMNVYLRAHIDHDFTYSVIQAHVERPVYGVKDEVVCYFCFPKHGIAVPLRPGDFLLINALEYHCVSSRCRSDDDVFVLSCYLKTAVVGGNDNKRELNEKEMKSLQAYDCVLKRSARQKN